MRKNDRKALSVCENKKTARKHPRLTKIAEYLLLALAAFCLIYWLICGVCAGFGISMLWIWPVGALFFVALALWISDSPPFRRIRRPAFIRIAVAALLAILFVVFALVEGLVIGRMNTRDTDGVDHIIILGAKVNGAVPSLALRERIECAYEVMRDDPDIIAVASGGRGVGEDISEAECMRRELVGRGISADRIILEDASTSTEENIKFSYEKLPDGVRVGLVTNNFHLFRAMNIAEKVGSHEISGIAADYSNPLLLHYLVREFFTVVVYFITGKI